MKKEYDFSKGERGKIYVREEDIEIPVYLDKKVRTFYSKVSKDKKKGINTIINNILKKEMDLIKEIS